MIKKLSSILLWVFVIAVQLQLIYIYVQPSDVVVNVEKVFNEFEMKKELQQKVQSIEKTQKLVLDSLDVRLNQLEDMYNSAPETEKTNIESSYQQLRAYRDNKATVMQEELMKAAENFDDQIWNQLNGYLNDYGKSKGVNIIFGQYQNNVMYHTSEMDMTQEAIGFVNDRYQGQ
jgi:outer membrane protein